MDGTILYLPLPRFSSLLAALVFFSLTGISVLAQPRLEGSLSETNYTSPSGRLSCAMNRVPIGSPYFSIDDSSTPEFEGVTFGYDDGNSYMSAETYIPYFYSELPYEISELSRDVLEEPKSSTGLLKIQFEGSRQIHGYWIRPLDGWFQSVQLLPALSSTPTGVLTEEEVRLALKQMVERCGFTSGKNL